MYHVQLLRTAGGAKREINLATTTSNFQGPIAGASPHLTLCISPPSRQPRLPRCFRHEAGWKRIGDAVVCTWLYRHWLLVRDTLGVALAPLVEIHVFPAYDRRSVALWSGASTSFRTVSVR